jgi:hypothetical protein
MVEEGNGCADRRYRLKVQAKQFWDGRNHSGSASGRARWARPDET